jgi:hypothetical protein
MSVRIPCCPVRISLRKLRIMIHTMEDMSTPKAGGISSLTGCARGSVGHTIILNGNRFTSVFGYLSEYKIKLRWH